MTTKIGTYTERLGTRLALAAAMTSVLAAWSVPARAFLFGSEEQGLSGSFDTALSLGSIWRTDGKSCRILGNDTGGCNRMTDNTLHRLVQLQPGGGFANADFNYTNFDDGDLNYRKGDLVSAAVKGTHDLALRARGGWSSLVRVTWHADAEVDDTRRLPLNEKAKDRANDNITLLDAWIAKDFDLGGRRAKLKLGNQVVSWGEDIFILGGVNQINAIDLQKFHVPGTQLKEIFVPAPMLWGSFELAQKTNLEAYYQFRWNGFKFDPTGTFFSTADVVGPGKKPAFIPTSVVEAFFPGTCATLPKGRCGDQLVSGLTDAENIEAGLALPFDGKRKPQYGGQFGVALRHFVDAIDSEVSFYYQRYHDKLPFLGFNADTASGAITSYFLAFGEDKNLFGASIATKLGPVAVGAEASYRPRDSVGIDPTVPFGALGGAPEPNPFAVVDQGSHPGFVNEKKWQFHLTGFYSFSSNDPLGGLVRTVGAADGFILTEAALTRYPSLDRSGRIPYFLPNYALPTKTSWGYVFEMGLNYPDVFDSGIVLTPQIDWFHDVHGSSPNTIPFVKGRKALTLSLLGNYRDRWKGGLQVVRFFGGGDNNLLRDRDFIGVNISRQF